MKIVKHGFVSPKSESMFRYNAWPTVITLPDGTLLAGWSGDRLKHICPFGKVLCARSLDDGYTWLPPYTVQDTVLDDRDAGLCAVGDKILMTSITEGREIGRKFLTHWLHAPENGAERDLITAYMSLIKDEDEKGRVGPTLAVSSDGGYTFTPPVWVPVTSPHGPTLLSNGEILFVGSLHRDLKNADRPAGIYAVRLDADCHVLGEPQPVAIPPEGTIFYCEPYAKEMPNGEILVAIRVQDKPINLQTIYLARSTDGGKTFSPVEETGWLGFPPHIFVTSKGEVVLTFGRREAPCGIRARVSRDSGHTWDEEIVLRDDGLDWDLGYPTTAENAKGELVTVYYQKEKLGPHENRIQYTIWTLD